MQKQIDLDQLRAENAILRRKLAALWLDYTALRRGLDATQYTPADLRIMANVERQRHESSGTAAGGE